MKTIAFVAAFLFTASAQSLEGELENALLPALLQGNVPGLAAALARNTSLSPLLNTTQLAPSPAPAQDDISVSITLPPAMVPIIAPAAAVRLSAPSTAPATDAFTGPPVIGAPLSVTAELAPGTVAVITPPTYGNASLPGELPMPQLLTSFVAPYLANLPGHRIHLLGSSTFLPRLPAPLQYSNVQGGIVVVLGSNASADAALPVPFQATVLGVSPSYSALAASPALSPAPANFTLPVLPGLNLTYYALAAGTPIPAVPSNFEFAQLAPGVLAIVSQVDQQYLTSPPVTEASPATPPGSASTAQDLVSSLTPDEVAALPSVPEGLQIILLPANLSLAGLPASMAIPASFTVPQQLQSYSYILTAASDALPVLPAGFNASSPSPGITIVYAEQAAPPPAAAPAGPPAASVLALPLSAVMEGPFVLSAAAPLATDFFAPPYLQDFRLSELPAGSLLPIVPTGFTVLPIYPGLTAVVQANSTLLPSSAGVPAPANSSVLDSPLPAALLNNMPAFSTPAGSLITGVPVTANASQVLASSNSTLYTGPPGTLPPDETYFVQPVQPKVGELFPGFGIEGILGSILGLAV